jgi:hypothetical protein
VEKLVKNSLGQWALAEEWLSKGYEISAPKILPHDTRLDQQVKLASKVGHQKTITQAAENAYMAAENKRIAKPTLEQSTWPGKFDVKAYANKGTKGSAFLLHGRHGSALVNTRAVGQKQANAIQAHEAFHLLTDKIRKQYGKKAKERFLAHLYNELTPDHAEALDSYVQSAYKFSKKPSEGHVMGIEEAIAHTINMRHSVKSRGSLYNHHRDSGLFTKREMHRNIRDSYRAMLKRMRTITLDEILPKSKNPKSDI